MVRASEGTAANIGQDEVSESELEKIAIPAVGHDVCDRDALEKLFSEVTFLIENSESMQQALQDYRSNFRTGGITISAIRRNLGRNDYSNAFEMLSDVYKMLRVVRSCAENPREISKFIDKLKQNVSKKLGQLGRSEVDQEQTSTRQYDSGPTYPSTQVEVRDLNNILQFIEKNDYRSLGYILKANSKLCRLYKKTSLYGTKFHWTPLHMAAYYGKTECVATLLKYGANVEDQDAWYKSRALGWAANGGHPALCKMLIEEYNADQHALNASGFTAFNLASDPTNPAWKGVFEVAGKMSSDELQSKVDNDSKKNNQKSQIKLLIKQDWLAPSSNLQKTRAQQPSDKISSPNPARPSLKIKLGYNPKVSQDSQQPPIKKVIIKVPGSQNNVKPQTQQPQQPQQQKRGSPTQLPPSKIILRSKKIADKKTEPEVQSPTIQQQSPKSPVTQVEAQQSPSTPIPSYSNDTVVDAAADAASLQKSHSTPFSYVPTNSLHDRGNFFSESVFPSIPAISTSRFVDALKAFKKTLVISVGIVSDRDMVRVVVPIPGTDLWSGASLNFGPNIRSLSVRLLMTDFDLLRSLVRKENLGFEIGNICPSYTVLAAQITKHCDIQSGGGQRTRSYIRLKALPLVSNGPYVHDCCVVLEHGLNKLELIVVAAIPENFDVVTQKIELFLMRS